MAFALQKWGAVMGKVNRLGDWLIENLVRLCVDKLKSLALDP